MITPPVPRGALRAVLVAAVVTAGSVPLAALDQDDFFNDGTLQEIRMVISGRDWDALRVHFDQNTYYPADFTWRGLVVRNVGIRSRGSGTRNGLKPSLHVDVNRYVANQEFLGLKGFELKNMYADPSMVRESVAMKIYTRMGLPASRETHVRLYVNNAYAGVYVLVESVDRTFVSRQFGALEADAENGGYLFEYKWRFAYGLEYLGPDLRAYAPLFEPQTRDTDAIANLYGPIEELIRAVNQTEDRSVVQAVGAQFDLSEFLQYLAVELFTVEWDGVTGNWGMNNFYLYRFHGTRRPVLIPWDRDHAFVWDGLSAAAFIHAPIELRLDTNVLVQRAMAVPELRRIFLDALMQCTAMAEEPGVEDARGWLEREIDRQAGRITAAVAEDPVFPFSMDEVQVDTKFLIDFARLRPGWVTCDVLQAEGAPACR